MHLGRIGACIQKLFIAFVVLQGHIVVVKIPAFMLRHAAVIKFHFYDCIKSPHKISQKRRSLRAGVIRVLLSSPASSNPQASLAGEVLSGAVAWDPPSEGKCGAIRSTHRPTFGKVHFCNKCTPNKTRILEKRDFILAKICKWSMRNGCGPNM
jgi:hypothetical protein